MLWALMTEKKKNIIEVHTPECGTKTLIHCVCASYTGWHPFCSNYDKFRSNAAKHKFTFLSTEHLCDLVLNQESLVTSIFGTWALCYIRDAPNYKFRDLCQKGIKTFELDVVLTVHRR
jgi:hypothetical protein